MPGLIWGDNVAKRPLILLIYLSFHVVGADVSVGLDKAIKFLVVISACIPRVIILLVLVMAGAMGHYV